MYLLALSTLDASAGEQLDTASIAVACHCMREVMMGLPSLLLTDAVPRPHPNTASLLDKLPRLIQRYQNVDLRADQDSIALPKLLVYFLADIAETRTKEIGRNTANASLLLTGGSDSKHPVMTQWKQSYDFFVGWAHLDRNFGRGRPLPKRAEIIRRIAVVEDVIDVQSALFFDNLSAVRDLLANANMPKEA
ncbi:hypothetical protein JOE37_002779 [Clavibacter michiganensis]|nr:hypothetical protein [Clavibacter michiganensis]